MNKADRRMSIDVKKLQSNLWMLAVAIAVIALIVNVIFVVRFVQMQREQEVLALQIQTTTATVNRIGDPQIITAELASTRRELEILRSLFPSRLRGPDTVATLIRLAERNDMKVTDVETRPSQKEKIGEHTYHALSIEVQLEGTLNALRDFLSEMEIEDVAGSRLDRLSITDFTLLTPVAIDTYQNGQGPSEAQYMLTASLQLSMFARATINPDSSLVLTSDIPEVQNQ